MKKYFLYPLFLLSFLANSFSFDDEEIRKIIEFQHQRNTAELVNYFTNTNQLYRKQAIMAFASVIDTNAVPPLLEAYKNEKNNEIKEKIAFALGQQRHSRAAIAIGNLVQKEKNAPVKAKLMEALGKCGDKDALEYLVKLKFKNTDSVNTLGQAKALFYFGSRDITSYSAVQLAIQLLHPEQAKATREMTSYMVSRLKKVDLSDFYVIVTILALHEKNDVIRRNMAFVLNRLRPEYALKAFEVLMKKEALPEVRINALKGMKNLEYDSAKSYFFNALLHKNQYVRQTGSEMILSMGKTSDSQVYFDKAKAETDFITKANMYAAALKYASEKNKPVFSTAIKQVYSSSTNPYEKGMLLKALGFYIENHSFIATEIFKDNYFVIKTNGFEALASIRKDSDFMKKHNAKMKQKIDLKKIFWGYVNKALATGDVALVALASELIREPKMRAKLEFTDYKPLENALAKLTLPRDIETAIEINKTLDFVKGTATAPIKMLSAKPINWELLKQNKSKKVKIETDKGEIYLKLFVEETPETVANFMELVNSGFYTDKVFHRVIPNFVIQTGCPRGDGYGNIEQTICSEFTTTGFGEGYIGMASAGNDTEGSQWFITQVGTPHLDGRYTTFGKVTKGLEIVNKINIGDKIKQITLVD